MTETYRIPHQSPAQTRSNRRIWVICSQPPVIITWEIEEHLILVCSCKVPYPEGPPVIDPMTETYRIPHQSPAQTRSDRRIWVICSQPPVIVTWEIEEH